MAENPSQNENRSIVALILAIIGAFLFNLPVIGLALLIPALIIAHKEYRANKDNAMALAAIIIGWIGMGLQILMLLFIIGVLFFALFIGSMGMMADDGHVSSSTTVSESSAAEAPRISFSSLASNGTLSMVNHQDRNVTVDEIQISSDNRLQECYTGEEQTISGDTQTDYQIADCTLESGERYEVQLFLMDRTHRMSTFMVAD